MNNPNPCPYYMWVQIPADIMSVILAEIGYIVALYRRRVPYRPQKPIADNNHPLARIRARKRCKEGNPSL